MELFYSHASRQKPLVREIADALGKDVETWVDENGIKTGDSLVMSLTTAIAEADLVVLLLCRDAAKSDWVRKEVEQALAREKSSGSTMLFVIVIDRDVLEDARWTFVKDRKYLTLNSFETDDVLAVSGKLRRAVFSWAVKRYDQLKNDNSLVIVDNVVAPGFAEWLKQEALADLDTELEETVVERRLSDVFVCPPLMRVSAPTQADEPTDTKSVELDYQDIITGDESWVIFVPPEFGQTSIARQIVRDSLLAATTLSKPRLPTIIEGFRWRHTRPHEQDFVRQLKRSSPEGLPRKSESMLHDGEHLVIFENVEISNVALIEFVAKIAKKYNQCRFIVLVRADLAGTPLADVTIGLGSEFNSAYVGVFKRSHVRRFISKWGVPPGQDIEQLVNTTMDRFSQLNVPITGVNLSFFMYVLQQIQDFSPVNLAVLIEMFIEALLDKNDPKMIFRHQFDFTNKVDYLAFVASTMAKRERYVISHDDLLGLSREYFESIAVAQSEENVVKYFLETQVFADTGDGMITFRYTIFFSFFLAKAMAASSEVRSLIISPDNCIRYLSEIDIYFGLVRNDVENLREVARIHGDADRALSALLVEAGLSFDNSFVERLRLSTDATSDAVVAAQVATLSGANGTMSSAQRDGNLSDPMEDRIGLIQQMRRPKFRDAVARWVLTLRAYSVALKNLELIPAAEKRAHLSVVLNSWSRAVAGSVVITQGLARDGQVQIGKVTIFVSPETKKIMQGKDLRWFFLLAPQAITDYMRRDLGSMKLSKLLEDDSVPGGGLLPLFIQQVLASDLRIPGYLGGISRLAEKLKKSPFLLEVMLWHMWRIYMRRSLKGAEEESFARVVAGLHADLKGLKGRKRHEELSRMMQKARRDKLVASQSSDKK